MYSILKMKAATSGIVHFVVLIIMLNKNTLGVKKVRGQEEAAL